MSTLRAAAGSLLVVGVAGTEMTGLERAWMKLVRPGGVILFRRNIAELKQTRALLCEATALCAPHAFRCVDVEGGTVDRLRDVLAPMPSAQTAARAGKGRTHGELIARAVRAFGFNTTLAPVLDLALPESAAVMGTRAAAANAADVTLYVLDFLAGLAAHVIAGCAKHFPGLGGGALDSHVGTPAIERAWNELWRDDLAPYRVLRDVLPMVMVNHAAYPRTPGKETPASASRFWMTTVLRKRIGYRGLIFSDDFEMGGILKFMPMDEAVIAALRAGMDTIEICHSAELILRAYEALVHEGERSAAFRRLLLARERAVSKKRAAMLASELAPEPTARQLETLRVQIEKFSAKLAVTA
jgi:beta-N-acetylhexosaminidase